MSKLKVKDVVCVRPRFGESGTIIETKGRGAKTLFKVQCESCSVALWFSEDELYVSSDNGFSWARVEDK